MHKSVKCQGKVHKAQRSLLLVYSSRTDKVLGMDGKQMVLEEVEEEISEIRMKLRG